MSPPGTRQYARAIVLGAGCATAASFNSGVLRALELADIGLSEDDLVVGTSAGAVIAAMLRDGLTPKDMEVAVKTNLEIMPPKLVRLVRLGCELERLRLPDLLRLWSPG